MKITAKQQQKAQGHKYRNKQFAWRQVLTQGQAIFQLNGQVIFAPLRRSSPDDKGGRRARPVCTWEYSILLPCDYRLPRAGFWVFHSSPQG